jgi:hypothetical protein
MAKILTNNFSWLVLGVCLACQNNNTKSPPETTKIVEAVAISPQTLVSNIEAQIIEGDSAVRTIEDNEETLEGGEEILYFDRQRHIVKAKKINYGETFQNIDTFYFAPEGQLISVKSEIIRYNRSTYEESSEPLRMKSEGIYQLFFDKSQQLLDYQKLNNLRKFEGSNPVSQEVAYWIARAKSIYSTKNTSTK